MQSELHQIQRSHQRYETQRHHLMSQEIVRDSGTIKRSKISTTNKFDTVSVDCNLIDSITTITLKLVCDAVAMADIVLDAMLVVSVIGLPIAIALIFSYLFGNYSTITVEFCCCFLFRGINFLSS